MAATKASSTAKAAGAASGNVAPRRVLEMMKEATGASDEDICVMLQLCGGDANEATTKLLESAWGAQGCMLHGPPDRGLISTHTPKDRCPFTASGRGSAETFITALPSHQTGLPAVCPAVDGPASRHTARSLTQRLLSPAPATHTDPFERVKTKQEKRREVIY
jgi:hypothetical protein